jgi:hypothetical protein
MKHQFVYLNVVVLNMGPWPAVARKRLNNLPLLPKASGKDMGSVAGGRI